MRIPVEVLVDESSTIVTLDCQCCKELLSSRLPGGILIPIASSLKGFFHSRGMRNIGVKATGSLMRRTYKGIIDDSTIPEMRRLLENAVFEFSNKRRSA